MVGKTFDTINMAAMSPKDIVQQTGEIVKKTTIHWQALIRAEEKKSSGEPQAAEAGRWRSSPAAPGAAVRRISTTGVAAGRLKIRLSCPTLPPDPRKYFDPTVSGQPVSGARWRCRLLGSPSGTTSAYAEAFEELGGLYGAFAQFLLAGGPLRGRLSGLAAPGERARYGNRARRVHRADNPRTGRRRRPAADSRA